jgi:putative membrane protein
VYKSRLPLRIFLKDAVLIFTKYKETIMNETVLQTATFNPKVKSYWTVVWVFVSAITVVGLPLVPIVAIIAWLMSGMVLKAMSAKLLERKLVVKRGVFFVVEKSIPLEKITDVALSQGPIMRFFGLYSLSFETAGQSAAGALVSLVGVNDAAAFREAILAQKDQISEGASTPNESVQPEDKLQALSTSVQNIEHMLAKLIEQKK